jgi:hypothetical protein
MAGALLATILDLTGAIPGALVPALGLMAAAVVARPMRFPRFHAHAGAPARIWDLDMVRFMAFTLCSIALASTWPAARVWVTLALIVTFGAGELVLIGDVRHLHRLLAPPPWDGAQGGPVRVEGIVEDPTPVEIGGTPAALGREIRGYVHHRTSGIKRQDFHARGTFLLRSAAGVVEIDPADVVWASSVVATRYTDKDEEDFVNTEIVPVGGRLAAVGWVEAAADRPPRLTKRDRVVVMFATGPGGDPRGLAAVALRGRWVTRVGLALCAAPLVWMLVR